MDNTENQDEKPYYEVATGKELKAKYGLTAENRPEIKLNPDKVLPEFRYLIPLAETWGISDDLIRGDVIKKANKEELRQLLDAMNQVNYDTFLPWLELLDKSGEDYIDEFIAFFCLTIAADQAELQLQRLEKSS